MMERQTTNPALSSPLMGEGWVGVNLSTAPDAIAYATPPQPLPIKGRGF
jgi:hypothetical protein